MLIRGYIQAAFGVKPNDLLQIPGTWEGTNTVDLQILQRSLSNTEAY